VQHSEPARFWNREAFNVNPVPDNGCMDRVQIASLRLAGPRSSRQGLGRMVYSRPCRATSPRMVANAGPRTVPLWTCDWLIVRNCSSIITPNFTTSPMNHGMGIGRCRMYPKGCRGSGPLNRSRLKHNLQRRVGEVAVCYAVPRMFQFQLCSP
jgi:hypothetical protein